MSDLQTYWMVLGCIRNGWLKAVQDEETGESMLTLTIKGRLHV